MALTATVFKASLDVSDLRRHHYQHYNLTLARHPSETDERMMLRLLAFALYADPALEFTRGLSSTDEPDLWHKADNGEITLWLELGNPTDKRLRKARSAALRTVVFSYGGRTADQWWKDNQASLQSFKALSVISLPHSESQALAKMARRAMQLQCTIDEGEVWLSDQQDSLALHPQLLMGEW